MPQKGVTHASNCTLAVEIAQIHHPFEAWAKRLEDASTLAICHVGRPFLLCGLQVVGTLSLLCGFKLLVAL
jgi:hypothetical protein